jgi:dTDP-4-amino-4,6-dideoxygalactose transaminase
MKCGDATAASIRFIQAALLRVKLAHLEAWNTRRRAIAQRYLTELAGSGVTLPIVPEWAEPAWHLFCVRHPLRDGFRNALLAAGVETLVHYPTPPHLQAAFADLGMNVGAFPMAEETSSTVLSLPIGPAMTSGQVDAVITAVIATAPG